jgi:hypothetical protein
VCGGNLYKFGVSPCAFFFAHFASVAEIAIVGHIDRVGNETGDTVKAVYLLVYGRFTLL